MCHKKKKRDPTILRHQSTNSKEHATPQKYSTPHVPAIISTANIDSTRGPTIVLVCKDVGAQVSDCISNSKMNNLKARHYDSNTTAVLK
jgi:hypothetical protein